MKKIGILVILSLSLGVLSGCTNDESDNEFETLTPTEEEQLLQQAD